MERILKVFAVWTVLAAALFAVVGRQEVTYYRLKKSGIATLATASASKPHGLVQYTFEANNRLYSGVGSRYVAGRSGATQFGDTLTVYYLPTAPDVNCLGSPLALFSAELVPVLLAVTLFPTAMILVVFFRRSLLFRSHADSPGEERQHQSDHIARR
jgi:hypothetical protein